MSAKGAVFNVANVASEQSNLIVPESPFSSPRRATMSGHMCNMICCTGSSSTNSGILIMSSESPHLENTKAIVGGNG